MLCIPMVMHKNPSDKSGSKSNRVVLIKSLKGNASAFPFFFLSTRHQGA
ncbi:hypothetical protein [Enterococcus avium]